jgi:osmoprotectant transport system substrate-binding protein/osmoprotectant transport system permease protein
VSRLVGALCILALALLAVPARGGQRVVVGSKAFPESWILGEVVAERARAAGAEVEHRQNLGGTEIVYEALRAGAIDVYPEYTGTVAQVILKSQEPLDLAAIRDRLAPLGLGASGKLGFNDGYGVAVRPEVAARLEVRSISDLARHSDLRCGFTHEFLGRADGFRGLAARYGLEMTNVRGIDHSLGLDAMGSGDVDVTDVYTTDAQIARMGLVLLTDDRAYFPRYDAVLLYRLELGRRAPDVLAALATLEGHIDERTMTRANARVVLDHASPANAAAEILKAADLPGAQAVHPGGAGETRRVLADVLRNTAAHVELVLLSLAAAVLIGLPLGIVAMRSRGVAALTLSTASLLQTVPSLALLALLIPFLGVGAKPAIFALFLYSLLPIVRNTYAGLRAIPASLSEAADAIGLSRWAKLVRVSLPMASPSIMAGVKTSAVINVGTATLAALIGADGLGNPILQGITLRDTGLILEGALPAAVLAIVVEAGFGLLDRVIVPRGLRL